MLENRRGSSKLEILTVLAMVRVTGATGRMRMIRYDRASETWSQP